MEPTVAKVIRPVIVLDVDETLIFGADSRPDYAFKGSDLNFKMGTYSFHVKARPGAIKLLKFLQEKFDLWVYSNGTTDYVHKITDYLVECGVNIESKKVISREGTNYNKQLAK